MSDGPTPKTSYAQNGEDVRAWRALRDVESPFYVEVGASHPFDDSLTAALYELGWRGLLVEADPLMAEELRKARPGDVVVAAAAHSTAGLLTFSLPESRGQGTVQARQEDPAPGGLSVPAVRLADVLADLHPPNVHFLSVDVEGHEREALLGLDLQRWRPWILCVEATAPDSRRLVHEQWEDVVLAAGYELVAFDGLNRWYVEAEHLDLRERVAEPFGVLDGMLDGWVRRDEAELARRVDETATRAARAEESRSVATKDLDALQIRSEDAIAQWRQTFGEEARLRQQAEERAGRCAEELALMANQRDAALAREAVYLGSKSWQLTAPLRSLRWRAGLRLEQRRSAAVPPAPPSAQTARPGDERRWSALESRLSAARRRRDGG